MDTNFQKRKKNTHKKQKQKQTQKQKEKKTQQTTKIIFFCFASVKLQGPLFESCWWHGTKKTTAKKRLQT